MINCPAVLDRGRSCHVPAPEIREPGQVESRCDPVERQPQLSQREPLPT